MKMPNVSPVTCYIIGGVLSIVCVIIWAFLGNTAVQMSPLSQYPLSTFFLFLICVAALLYYLKRKSVYIAFGLISGLITILLFIIIIMVELAIHPPSEE